MQLDRGLHEQLQFTGDLLQSVPAQLNLSLLNFAPRPNSVTNSTKLTGKNMRLIIMLWDVTRMRMGE